MKLAYEIVLAIGAVLLGYGLIAGLLLDRQIQGRLLEEQSTWASALTTAMAEGIVDNSLNGDALAVRDTLRSVIRNQDRLAYAYVTDFDGRLFAHSFAADFPGALAGLQFPAGRQHLILDTPQGRVLHLRKPLVRDTDAVLYLGINLAAPERLVAQLRWQQVAVMTSVALIALLLALYLGRQLSRPLDRLAEAMQDYGGGRPVDVPDLAGTSREVAVLSRHFAQMMADRARLDAALQRAHDDLEDQVRVRTSELKAANDELEAFAYSVSHDLRTPLRGIDGFARALVEDYADRLDATGKDYLSRVRNGAQRMGLLIDDLLQLSRVSRAALQPGNVDLSALAGEIVAGLAAAEPQRAVEVVIAPRLTVRGDARLLEIALTNLLDNAWKYTGQTAYARVEFGQQRIDGTSAFYVRDNGAGFDMQYAGRLFGAFQRLHKPEEFPGTGVGLATVARIIQRHGGRIWAEGETGKGACFYFTLDAARA